MSNKAVQRLEERMADLEPGTIRYETLEAARRFKTSWVELGRMLWTVYRDKKFREWGYLTFDAYCLKEVGIKGATAKKLLNSYYFLEKEEPAILKKLTEEPPAQVPQVDSVNLLRLLKNKGEDVPPQNYQKVRSYVLEQGKDVPEVRREVRSVMKAMTPESADEQTARHQVTVRRMIGTLKGLRDELKSADRMPAKLLEEVDRLMKKLSELI